MTTEAEQAEHDREQAAELRRLGQDIHLFLRLCRHYFDTRNDQLVIDRLDELATQYAHGVDISNLHKDSSDGSR